MKALLQVLLRTAPDVMRNAELHNIHKSSNEDLSDDEIFTLRSKGTNAAIKIDGRFFRAPGQGSSPPSTLCGSCYIVIASMKW